MKNFQVPGGIENVQQFLPAKQKKILLHLFYAIIGKKKLRFLKFLCDFLVKKIWG
jgi:hypothetical protein